MLAGEWIPEIVIGVDFGMTYTVDVQGVAYSIGPEWPAPKTVQHWPGRMISEIANKVPTRLQYEDDGHRVKYWGFSCELDNLEVDLVETFKLHLDPEYHDPRPDSPSLEQARKWYRDYLSCLHEYLEAMFSQQHRGWQDLRCEFRFSVPTTWRSPALIAQILAIIKSAGFGNRRANHHAVVGLTEAEAAAVYASKQQIEKDEVILICDAGGGTTDVNVLKVDSHRGEATKLQQLGCVEGRAVGSVLIDQQFQQLLFERLQMIRTHLECDPDTTAENMMTQGRFERLKCSFGPDTTYNVPTVPLTITGMPKAMTIPDLRIEDGKMTINMKELKILFDVQVDKMLKLIDEQLAITEEKHRGTRISHLVLSGGLGSSPYVLHRLQMHFRSGSGSLRSNTERMEVRPVDEPQLAVVHGLVLDRVQFVARKEVVFKERCCRNSYGMVYRQLYDPTNAAHVGQDSLIDPRDGQKYVKDQVAWFMRQGQSVPSEGVTRSFYIYFTPGEEHQVWRSRVVMSEVKGKKIPISLSEGGISDVCMVESTLKDKKIDMKIKNRHFWQRGPKYLRFKFDVKVVLGPADIKFQMQTKDQQVFSTQHEDIQVTWYASSEASTPQNGHAEMTGSGIYSKSKEL